MNNHYEKLIQIRDYIKKIIGNFKPRIGIVLGSGLGNFHSVIDVKIEIPYSKINGFPVSTVVGHAGKYLFGYLNDVPVICMQGRVHYYEGFDIADVVLPIRIMGLLGIEKLVLTNAAGGTNVAWETPSIMLIKDHLNFNVPNPLIGPNIDELGPRFPDMSNVYDIKLQDVIRHKAKELSIPLNEGVYIQFTGPSYETPSEVILAKNMGADAIGMSTVCEAIAARHMGIMVCGLSCICNLGGGLADHPLSHEEVTKAAQKVEKNMSLLVQSCIPEIDKITQ